MDFTFTEDQLALGKLARELLDRHTAVDRLTEIEAGDVRHDPALWTDLASADLLGIALPTSVGGSGCGFLELAIVMSEIGRSVAPVPAFATLVLGADTIARHGDSDQQQRYLPAVANGQAILTAALTEPGRSDPAAPQTTARHDSTGWRIDGVKELVAAAQISHAMVVPAETDHGVELFVVPTDTPGVSVTPVATTSGQPHADVTFDGVAVDDADRLRAVGDGSAAVSGIVDRALVALSATQLGVTERALRIAATYTREREQFAAPIGSFQAVQQRMADAFIDVEAIRWTTWHAAWLITEGRSAQREARIAKFWASEGGMRVAATAQQVHGGIGIDTSYPLFRYFLWAKHNELALGPAAVQLERLGRRYGALEEPAPVS